MGNIPEDSRDRNGWTVDLGHKKTAEDDLVELCISSPRKEPIDLDQHLKIRVVGSSILSMVSRFLVLEIDTHFGAVAR